MLSRGVFQFRKVPPILSWESSHEFPEYYDAGDSPTHGWNKKHGIYRKIPSDVRNEVTNVVSSQALRTFFQACPGCDTDVLHHDTSRIVPLPPCLLRLEVSLRCLGIYAIVLGAAFCFLANFQSRQTIRQEAILPSVPADDGISQHIMEHTSHTYHRGWCLVS